jgi:serine phosphatase RsbU (regulator of sigma subunit)/ligand-binding sensor domain-containing protein
VKILINSFCSLVLVCLFFLAAGGASLFSANELGNPNIRNYTPEEYGAHPQNWIIARDFRGVIYAANNYGILEFDGRTWNPPIENANKSMIYSMDINSVGIVYVGGVDEFGYLALDAKGSKVYVSLSSQLNNGKGLTAVGQINGCYATDAGVYFVAQNHLFYCHDFAVAVTPISLHSVSGMVEGEKLVIGLQEGGICTVIKNTIQRLPGSEIISSRDLNNYKILPYSNREFLIVSAQQGLLIFSMDSDLNLSLKTRIAAEFDDYLKANLFSYAQRISSDMYAIGTVHGGIILFAKTGELIQIINTQRGLQDSTVNMICPDTGGNFWAALNYGIDYVEAASPISRFQSYNGLEGIVLCSHRHQGRLYAGNFKGMFYLPDYRISNQNDSRKFMAIKNVSGACFDFVSLGDILLGNADKGICQVIGKKARLIIQSPNVFTFGKSSRFPGHVFCGNYHGLFVIRVIPPSAKLSFADQQDQWAEVELVNNNSFFTPIREFVRKIVSDDEGNLWLSSEYNGIIYIRFHSQDINDYTITRYSTQHGLPAAPKNTAHIIHNQLLVGTLQGVYLGIGFKKGRFDPNTIRFVQDTAIGKFFAKEPKRVVRIHTDSHQNYWMSYMNGFGISMKQADGSFQWYDYPFREINGFIESFHIDDNGIGWLSGVESRCLFRFDSNKKKDYSQDYFTLIRKVVAAENNVLLFGSYFESAKDSSGNYLVPAVLQPKKLNFRLPYSQNSILIGYAATFYEKEEFNRFQYQLNGYQSNWSDWSDKNEKEFTNLPEGSYIFSVRAKNIFDHISSTAEFHFSIAPPWYRTYWSYALYFLVFVFFIYSMVKLNTQRLIAAKKKLELIIAQRTQELIKKNQQITNQKNRIEHYAVQLKTAKDEIWGEMELAKKIQTTLLPENPHIPGYDMAVYMNPADEVGGDYYDVIYVENNDCRGGSCARPQESRQSQRADLCSNDSVENRESAYAITPDNSRTPTADPGQPQGFAPTGSPTTDLEPSYWLSIGDVSGHGVSAGLVMMMVQTAIRTALDSNPSQTPQNILAKVNRIIFDNINKLKEDKYMTITLMSVQADGTLHYSGLHQDIMVFHQHDRAVELIETKGMWLGLTPEIYDQLQVEQIHLNPGDTMLLYTDGIIEAFDSHGQMYSEEKLIGILKDHGHLSCEQIKKMILHSLSEYNCQDDVSLVILKYLPVSD